MPIFKTAPCYLNAPYPPQVVDAVAEQGHNIERHGPLYHIGIHQDLAAGPELRSWWFAEDLTAEPSVVPDGWTVLETAALFDREGMDTDDQTVNVALELLLPGVATDEIPLIHDKIFKDVNGVYRSRWFTDVRGPSNPFVQGLANVAVQHVGVIVRVGQGAEDQVAKGVDAQPTDLTGEDDDDMEGEMCNDLERAAANCDQRGTDIPNQYVPLAAPAASEPAAPQPVSGSANDPRTHAFPCPMPACTIGGRTMNRRALVVIHMREHGCNLPKARGGPADKTAYNKMQNKVARRWLNDREISWRNSVFELGADDEDGEEEEEEEKEADDDEMRI
ncbi:hypothetical protein LTR78_009941 [Recurvomyces mirabilis]|uniref:Uncharacterized protein n=1 Tax=Recurvomyces mirabilis TaxID=574656 RepID=A0AAE0TME3_9PEZI|nr:hypothetical protein LTR78_009941 [Recurvomyces mirabilis]